VPNSVNVNIQNIPGDPQKPGGKRYFPPVTEISMPRPVAKPVPTCWPTVKQSPQDIRIYGVPPRKK